MNIKKTHLATALLAALGSSAVIMQSAEAASLLPDGSYQIVINTTPYTAGVGSSFGTDGAWNSGFTCGCQPGSKGCASVAMDDFLNTGPINGRGGTINDGVAGRINITVANGVILGGNLFQVDNILGAVGGDFAQYTADGTASGMTGTIDAAGNMTFTPINRLGTFKNFPALVDERWNVDNFNGITPSGTSYVVNPPTSNTAWNTFTTGAATNIDGTTHGTPCTSLGGSSYGCVLVTAFQFGSDWGGFYGATVSERWKITLTAVPVPAAAWLFGSGLVGLLGIARRKKPLS